MCNFSVLRYLVMLLAILCVSCGTTLPKIKPYKIDVQQGNVVTSAMLLQLRPGMTQSQVRFIMGTPLIQDSFHGKRWDYVYQMREQGKITEQRRVILDFENEILKTVRGDVIPTGNDLAKSGDGVANTGARVINPSAKTEQPSLFDQLKFWEKDEAKLAEEAMAVQPAVKSKVEANEATHNATELVKAPLAKEPIVNARIAEGHPTSIEEARSLLVVPIAISPILKAPATVAEVPATSAEADRKAAELVKENLANPVLATSMEILPIIKTPTMVAVAPAAVAPSVAVTSVIVPATVALTPVQTVLEKPAMAVQDSTLKPTIPTATVYYSPSGLKLDRSLRLAPEDLDPQAKSGVIVPRAGNKTIPKPKDLPAENSPSFFDKMLEKIGF